MNIREWSKDIVGHPIFKILIAVLFLWIVYKIRFILATVFLSYIVAVSLLPIKRYLLKNKVPEPFASIAPYFVLIAFLGLTIYSIAPTIASQLRVLAENFPEYISEASSFLGEGTTRSYIEETARSLVGNLAETLVPVTREAVRIITYAVAGFVLSIYALSNHESLKKWFVEKINKNPEKVSSVMDQIENGLGRWMRGQITVGVVVGLLVSISLSVIGLDFALTLGIIAGLLEFIPYIGPIIAAVPAIAVGFSYSASTALTVAAVFALIQLLENNLIVPSVMKYSVKLNPGIVILLILIGTELFGVAGAILAVPVAAVVKIVTHNLS